MVRRILLTGLVAGLAVAVVGCRHCCKHRGFMSPRSGLLGDPIAPRGDFNIPPPPGGLPSTLPPATIPDTSLPPASIPGSNLPPPTISDDIRFRLDPSPNPARPNGPQLLLPDPLPGFSSATPRANRSGASDLPPQPMPPAHTAGYSGTVPGLAEFTIVQTGVATGRKPAVEGFDQLQSRGYRTAVYLHDPNEDVSAAKDLAEKKGLTFVGIPTSPETLPEAFTKFREMVSDAGRHPMFIFDNDGVRTGSLWYLYFRVVDQFSDDAARVRAAPVGLRETGGEDERRFWRAIQAYLAKL